MKKRKKLLQKCLIFMLMFIVAGIMLSTESYAYFQRGNVGVSVGKHSVTLNQGGSETVSVSFSPSSSRQLPGCGMAECPQTCGEKDCLDANGECKCNGTTYKTYYAAGSAYSSNTSVASASCSGNSVVIKGISPGTATITVTASLRQFTSTSTTISVTVNKSSTSSSDSSSSSASSSGSSSSAKSDSGSSSGKVKAKAVDGDKTKKKDAAVESQETKKVESDRGEITFVQIPDGKAGKKELESIIGEKAYVDFQKKDASDTILYAWEFLGTDLNEARDMNLNLYFSTEPFEGCAYGSADDSIYIKRGEKSAFSGKATTYIRVAEWFKDGDKLYLYTFSEDEGLGMLEKELKVVNGYVTSSAMYGEDNQYILSSEKWDAQTVEAHAEGNIPWVPIAAGIVIIALAAATVVYRKKKGKR